MRLGLLLVALFVSRAILSGQQGGVPEQSLATAQEQSDIFNRAPRPFLLEADLTVQLAVPTPGHLKIQWLSRNHWHRELEYGPYKESVVRIGEQEYALRNVGFAPLRTTQLVELLHFAKGITGFVPYTTKTRKQGGIVQSCIELAETKSNRSCELCSDSVTHEIVSMSPWIYDVEGGKAEFSDYDELEGMRFPRHLELRINKVSAVSISISRLQEQTVDASVLTPPPGSIERRYCDAMTAPVMIHRPDLSFPENLHATLLITVLKDGSVGSVQVIGQSSAQAADFIRRKFRDATFKPAMCGAEPVVADIDKGIDITH